MGIIYKTYIRLVFWFDSLSSKDEVSKRVRKYIYDAINRNCGNELTPVEKNILFYMESAFQRCVLIFLQSLLLVVVLFGVISR